MGDPKTTAQMTLFTPGRYTQKHPRTKPKADPQAPSLTERAPTSPLPRTSKGGVYARHSNTPGPPPVLPGPPDPMQLGTPTLQPCAPGSTPPLTSALSHSYFCTIVTQCRVARTDVCARVCTCVLGFV